MNEWWTDETDMSRFNNFVSKKITVLSKNKHNSFREKDLKQNKNKFEETKRLNIMKKCNNKEKISEKNKK